MRRPVGPTAWLLLALAGAAAHAASIDRPLSGLESQPPPAGSFDATLCVAVAAAAPDCGPVSAQVEPGGRTEVRVSDFVYLLEVWGDQLGITLMHGTMQVDGFFAPYRWRDRALQFRDVEKDTRYELQLGPRRFDPH